MRRTELAHGNTPGIGQAAQRLVAALCAFEDFAGDVAPGPVLLGSGRQGLARPIKGDFHVGQSAGIEAFRDHASSPSCRGTSPRLAPPLKVFFVGLPRLAKNMPCKSAAFCRMPAFFIASFRSGP